MKNVNIKKCIRENSGITLTTLVITVIVLLILAGVATSTGIEAIENTKHTKFVAELKIMQSYVNQWYEDCKPNNNETFEGNIASKFTAVNAKNATEDEQAQTTLNNANILSSEYENYYLLEDSQKSALEIEGVSQAVLISVKDRKVVSYLGLKWKNKMYYTIDDQRGDGIGEIYNVEYKNPNTNAPTIEVTGKSVYYGETAKNAKYRFTVDVTQGSSYINKGDLYYGKIENGNVKTWNKTTVNTFLVDREGTYKIYYKDAAGNVSNVEEYVIEPKATLVDGASFNVKMKTLAGTNSPTTTTENSNIIEFKIATIKPNNSILVSNNIVSTSDSKYKVYMWFENGIIWLWSEENWIYLNASAGQMFRYCNSIEHINLEYFDTSKSRGMWTMFHNCSKLKELDLYNFNTENVNSMNSMFNGCTSLEKLNIKSFKTHNVTDNMNYMFCNCSNLTNLDISSFDTSNVISMQSMFYGCSSLTELDLGNFNTQNVTDMSTMFCNCRSLTELDLSNLKTNKVTNMWYMFVNCSNLRKIYVSSYFTTSSLTNEQIANYETGNTTSTHLFKNCTSLIGGNNTIYSASHIDADYAHIDGGTSNPGYFTKKE